MKYIIASDFHLKYIENEDDRVRRIDVESFLLSLVGQIDGLILAGDVFDFWLEWKHVIIKNYFSTLMTLATLKNSGVRLIYLSGNHDFWLGDFLKNTIGFEIYSDFFTDEINGKKIFVSHGDLYTKNDLRYKVYRRFIRQKFVKYMLSLLHPNFCLSLTQKVSRTSRNRKDDEQTAQRKEEGQIQKAEKLSNKYDLIVFGHSHNPLQMSLGNATYINTGDWLTHNSYCYFDDETIQLKYHTNKNELDDGNLSPSVGTPFMVSENPSVGTPFMVSENPSVGTPFMVSENPSN